MGITDKLNPQQKEAVEYCDGHQAVLAGAGSGKTKVLTSKIAYLINEKGVAPWRILALTFTNKAAHEMKERAEKLLESDRLACEISTFHAYGLRFLHRYSDVMQKMGYPYPFVVFDRNDTKSILKKVYAELNIDAHRLDMSAAIQIISNAKTSRHNGEMDIADRWRGMYEKYEEYLHKQGALDFDDLISVPLEMLSRDKGVLELEQSRLDWILVDEYQDVNGEQYRLLKLLVGKEGRKIMVVGDPDQSIYGWRGADMSIILNFKYDFAGAKTTVLNQNYRSTGNILAGANGVIQCNDNRPEKDLWTASDVGSKIKIKRFLKDSEEANWIAENIERLYDDGYKFSEMAILYRMNALSRGLEEALLERSIPYRVVRGVAFYDRAEVKDVMSMLRIAVNPHDTVSLSRAANIPPRGLGPKAIERLTAAIADAAMLSASEIWEQIKENGAGLKGKQKAGAQELAEAMLNILDYRENVAEAINIILVDNGYEEYLHYKYEEDFEERIENIKEILSVIEPDADLAEALTQIPLATDADSAVTEDCVSLLTLHAAKGLEYPVVFMPAVENGIFPSQRAVEEREDGIEEERRLFYVGMTRAKEQLFISCSANRMLFGQINQWPISDFIGEIPEDVKIFTDETKGRRYDAYRRSDRRRWSW